LHDNEIFASTLYWEINMMLLDHIEYQVFYDKQIN